jgi:hypothetical protein
MECIEGTGQLIKERRSISLFTLKKNRRKLPKQNHAFSGPHKHSRTKHSYSVSFFLLSTRQMDKKSNTPPTSDTVFLFLGEKRRTIKGHFAFFKSAKVAIFRQ